MGTFLISLVRSSFEVVGLSGANTPVGNTGTDSFMLNMAIYAVFIVLLLAIALILLAFGLHRQRQLASKP
jgi:hypothetical protein